MLARISVRNPSADAKKPTGIQRNSCMGPVRNDRKCYNSEHVGDILINCFKRFNKGNHTHKGAMFLTSDSNPSDNSYRSQRTKADTTKDNFHGNPRYNTCIIILVICAVSKYLKSVAFKIMK